MSEEILNEPEELKKLKTLYYAWEKADTLVNSLEAEYNLLHEKLSGTRLRYATIKIVIDIEKAFSVLHHATTEFCEYSFKYPQYRTSIKSIMSEDLLDSYDRFCKRNDLADKFEMVTFRSIVETAQEKYRALKLADDKNAGNVSHYSTPEYTMLLEEVHKSIVKIRQELSNFDIAKLECYKKYASKEFKEYYKEYSRKCFICS